MTTEEQYRAHLQAHHITLETAKKLYDAGVEQWSNFYYRPLKSLDYALGLDWGFDMNDGEWYSAFSASELGVIINQAEVLKYIFNVGINSMPEWNEAEKMWVATAAAKDKPMQRLYKVTAPTEAECRGLLLLKRIELGIHKFR